MQTWSDRGEPGRWEQLWAPGWSRGEGRGRAFALFLLPRSTGRPQQLGQEKAQLWLGGEFSTGGGWFEGRMPSAVGEKLCVVSMPSVAAFSQMPGRLPVQLADRLVFRS